MADHVNNVTPFSSLGATWDSNKSAYMFSVPTGGQYCLRYNINNINNYLNGFTVAVDVLVQSFTGTCDIVTFGYPTSKEEDVNQAVAIMETHRFTGFTTMSWHRLVMTITRYNNGAIGQLYIDGNLVRTISPSQSSFPKLRNTLWTGDVLDYITIGCSYYTYGYTAFFKNIMIFNRVLGASEVAQL